MIKILLILLLIAIIATILIIYLNAVSKLMETYIKINKSYSTIETDLNRKYEYMKDFAKIAKKINPKKDYLKDFNKLNIDELNLYELDKELDKFCKIMLDLKDDNKKMQTDEIEQLAQDIKDVNQDLSAAKKYFNKNNNKLMKSMKGYYKLVAKISKIKVNTLFEVKNEKK